MTKKIKLVHIIIGLNVGGAETMLYKLVQDLDKDVFENHIISLTDCGIIGEKIKALGVPIYTIGMNSRIPNLNAFIKLIRLLRNIKPDIVQNWMYHANLIGGLAAKFYSLRIPVLWGIRHGYLDPKYDKKSTIFIATIGAYISRAFAKKVIYNSESAEDAHISVGYSKKNAMVIYNGFDLSSFKPDLESRASVRLELSLKDDTILVGMIARYHPLKEHKTFFAAAAAVNKKYPDVHFVLCGHDVSWSNNDLIDSIPEGTDKGCFHLLGTRTDIPRIAAALDIFVLPSAMESFSNTIGEAMACSVPCIVTNVGDSASIVGDTGYVVSVGDVKAIASSIIDLIEDHEKLLRLGVLARNRVQNNYELSVIINNFAKLYLESISVVSN